MTLGGVNNVLKQVALDQLLHHPFFFFPAFYTLKTAMDSDFTLTVGEAFRKGAVETYFGFGEGITGNIWEDLPALWQIWVPAFLFNFSFCPNWLRIPFVAAVSFGFTMVLSVMRGAPAEEGAIEDDKKHAVAENSDKGAAPSAEKK